MLADWMSCDHAARALHQRFKAAAIAGLPEKHWSLTDDDLGRIFETMCKDRPWLDRVAVLEDGPTVQIVDPYAEHPGEFLTVVAIVPHDNSEANDEVVVSLQDGSQLSLNRDQVNVAIGPRTKAARAITLRDRIEDAPCATAWKQFRGEQAPQMDLEVEVVGNCWPGVEEQHVGI